MARRPAHTLVFVAADRTARIDLGRAPALEVMDRRQFPGSAAEDVAARVARALELGGPCGRQVWVLWEGAWTQTVEMPAAAVAGLEREQLARALAFEVEPLSAVPATESVLDVVAQGNGRAGRRVHWVTQVSGPVCDAVRHAVENAGGRLAGIVHPGGLPRAGWSGPRSPGPWCRVEVWEQAVVCLQGGTDGAVEVKVINARPGNVNWRAALEHADDSSMQWMGRTSPPEVLSEDGLPRTWTVVDLPSDEPPTDWMRAWAEELTARSRRVPVTATPVAGRTSMRPAWVGAAAAVLTAAVCGWHAHSLMGRTEAARADADREQAMREALSGGPAARKALEQRERELKAAMSDLKAKTEAAERDLTAVSVRRNEAAGVLAEQRRRHGQIESMRAGQRRRWPALLEALLRAESDESNVLVLGVKPEAGGWKLTGICSKPNCADDFAAGLAVALEKYGWRIEPAQTRLRADEAAWDFWLRLTVDLPPTAPGGEPRSPVQKTGPPAPAVPRGQVPPSRGGES